QVNIPVASAEARHEISTDELDGKLQVASKGYFGRDHLAKWGKPGWAGGGSITLVRYTAPSDIAFDDVTAFVPALLPDDADEWRARLARGAGADHHQLDAAARDLLARARR